jgi:hypothetical protein
MNTDDALAYYHMSKEFAAHGVVNHSKDEYVSKDGQTHIQSAEAFFAILKRGVMGSFHSISEQHLQQAVCRRPGSRHRHEGSHASLPKLLQRVRRKSQHPNAFNDQTG